MFPGCCDDGHFYEFHAVADCCEKQEDEDSFGAVADVEVCDQVGDVIEFGTYMDDDVD